MSIDAALVRLQDANRALERMSDANGIDAFHGATRELLAAVRSVFVLVAQLGYSESSRVGRPMMTESERLLRMRFDSWLETIGAQLARHRLAADDNATVDHSGSPIEIRSRHVPQAPATDIGIEKRGARLHIDLPTLSGKPEFEQFFFAFDDARTALDICADYLDRATVFHEAAKAEAIRLGLGASQ